MLLAGSLSSSFCAVRLGVFDKNRFTADEDRARIKPADMIPFIHGQILLYTSLAAPKDRRRTNAASSSRSVARNKARPDATTTEGSGAVTSVHAAGSATNRCSSL